MARGGRRSGAGHPTNAEVELRRASAGAAKFVAGAEAELPETLSTLIQLARGIWVQGCSRCRKCAEDCLCADPATIRIYRRPPDRQANEILVEHGRGRAAQAAAASTDTSITLVCNVPRPGKVKQ